MPPTLTSFCSWDMAGPGEIAPLLERDSTNRGFLVLLTQNIFLTPTLRLHFSDMGVSHLIRAVLELTILLSYLEGYQYNPIPSCSPQTNPFIKDVILQPLICLITARDFSYFPGPMWLVFLSFPWKRQKDCCHGFLTPWSTLAFPSVVLHCVACKWQISL